VRRFGINALYLIPGRVGGSEIYLRHLLRTIAAVDQRNLYFVYHNRETGSDLTPDSANFVARPLNVRAVNRPARLFWEQALLPIHAARDRLHALLNGGFTAPVLTPCPSITVFYDMQHKRHPEYFRWWDLPFWRLFLFSAAVSSDALITISEASRRDLLHYYPAEPSRVHTIHPGVDPAFFRLDFPEPQPRSPAPYILTVSTLHPHKNQERLLRAFARFRQSHPEYRLVICGMHGFHTARVLNLISDLGLQDWVETPGWIPRDQLYRYYREAEAFVYPSLFEGFGLPVLEAMAAGLPTACSDIPVLREVADSAALLFDPTEEQAIAAALRQLVSDNELRQRLAAEGAAHAAEFSWNRSAEQTVRLLEYVSSAARS
jgi:glycosyltransferase involved in cell wall biosynthesis